MPFEGIGASVRRKEDARFLSGRGNYTDDINRPGQLHAFIRRSDRPHAKINGIDTAAAAKAPGVVAVFTGADMAADNIGGLPCGWQIHNKDGSPMAEPPHPVLAVGKVRHVGDPVAVVIAETKQAAKDAAELIVIDYQDLPAAATLRDALAPGAALVHDDVPGNICYDWHIGDKAVVDARVRRRREGGEARSDQQPADPERDGAARRDRRVRRQQRRLHALHHQPEPACDPAADGRLRAAHPGEQAARRRARCRRRLRLEDLPLRRGGDRHLGGGQGAPAGEVDGGAHRKLHVRRAWPRPRSAPPRWRWTRTATSWRCASRRWPTWARYLSTFAPCVPTYLYATLLAGVYKTPVIYCEVKAVFTNTVPVDAYRGAGRPEATFLLERLVDACAHDTGMDRVAIRRQNFIPADAFPYQTPVALQYDSGNYQATLDACLKAADYAGFEARRAAAAAKGKLRGIGISTYIEACGIAPSAVVGSLGARAGLYEVANIRVHPDRQRHGLHRHAQPRPGTRDDAGAARLSTSSACRSIRSTSCTATPRRSRSAWAPMAAAASRSAARAMVKAMDKIIAKGKKIAAHLMEASVDDIEFKDGTFTVAGTDKSKTLTDISLAAYVPHNYPIEELEPGLDETAFYDPKNFTFPGGCHIAEVEIDPDTGVVEVVNFVAVDDVGRVINPMIVEGQVQGGVAQGIGQALLENAVYDESGQLLSGSMMDYTMPRADDLPNITVGTETTLCTHNPLGVKGCGEVGAIGSPPAVINAIVDALKDYGVRHIDMPATPQKLWSIIQGGTPRMAAE